MPYKLLPGAIRKAASWIWSPTRLAKLIMRAHGGEISIEEFSSTAAGRWRPLTAAVTKLLLDLKQQRAERASLEQEIRDRIANRTDALERRIGSLEVQATHDALTGLSNRRGLNAELPKVVEQFLAGGSEACLLMIDVDHFKQLNDTLGHPAGDQLLREIGQLIRCTLRGQDQSFRSGGDEFVIILGECGLKEGMIMAERLCSLVKELTRSMPVVLPPQLSIGVCAFSEVKDLTPELLIQTADNRLYAVKSARPHTRRSA